MEEIKSFTANVGSPFTKKNLPSFFSKTELIAVPTPKW